MEVGGGPRSCGGRQGEKEVDAAVVAGVEASRVGEMRSGWPAGPLRETRGGGVKEVGGAGRSAAGHGWRRIEGRSSGAGGGGVRDVGCGVKGIRATEREQRRKKRRRRKKKERKRRKEKKRKSFFFF